MKKFLLFAVLLSTSALAGGGGPRPLLPAFVPFGEWNQDCNVKNEPGCRMRVALPAVGGLKVGDWRVVQGMDQLSLVYRAPAGTKSAQVCCGLQLPLSPVPGTDLWGVTAWVKDAQKAVLNLGVATNGNFAQHLTAWRGSQAPVALKTTEISALKGQISRPTLVSGNDLTGNRSLSVYTPPNWTAAESLPVVYLADNAADGMAQTLEPLILAGKAPRVVLVGIENGGYIGTQEQGKYDPQKDKRALEYLEGFEGGKAYFEAHEKFVLEKVIPEIERTYHVQTRPESRAVAGFSNGASWAISMAARNPGVFGGVIAMSPGWNKAFAKPSAQARVFASGGTLEPHFLDSAELYAFQTKQAGNPTQLVERVGGHDNLIWQEVFPGAVNFVLNFGGRK